MCLVHCYLCFLFDVIFFCKQKTAYEMRISDWSSDVCSSDLLLRHGLVVEFAGAFGIQAEVELVVPAELEARLAQGVVAHLRAGMALGEVDRTSVVSGQRVSVRVDIGGRRIIKRNKGNIEIKAHK